MNIPKQPESQAHGDAWRAFCDSKAVSELMCNPVLTNNAAILRYGWLCWLGGWLGKAKQADALRNR